MLLVICWWQVTMLCCIEKLWRKVLHVMALDVRRRGRQEKEIFEGSQFCHCDENCRGCITSIGWGFYWLWCFRGGREGEESAEQDVPRLLRILLLVEFVVWVGVRMRRIEDKLTIPDKAGNKLDHCQVVCALSVIEDLLWQGSSKFTWDDGCDGGGIHWWMLVPLTAMFML